MGIGEQPDALGRTPCLRRQIDLRQGGIGFIVERVVALIDRDGIG